VFTRQGVGPRRQQVFAIFVALIVVGAVGCSVRVGVTFTRADRENFITSSNRFAKAFDAMDAAATDGNKDERSLLAAARPAIDAMRRKVTEMNRLARKVTGKAHTIATKASAAAAGMVGAANRYVVARTARDAAGRTAAITDVEKAKGEFNKQIRAWNAL
jgi:hypothetical protein